MDQLTNLDSAFLHLETNKLPMHVGCFLLFKQPSNGSMTYQRFRQHMKARMQTSAIFRRKLLQIPLSLDLPYWVEDDTFRLDNHLKNIRVEKVAEIKKRHKGGIAGPSCTRLTGELIEEFMEKPLDRSRPLWEALYVEGKTGDYFVVALKVHHAAIDGVSGEEVLLGLLDFTEQPRQLPKDSWNPNKGPSWKEIANIKTAKLINKPQRVWELVKSGSKKAITSVGLRLDGDGGEQPLFYTSPDTLFNDTIRGRRVFANTQLPLDVIKQIKNSRDGYTVNDVVLAICSGALRRYLLQKGDLPQESLTAMAPVSLRQQNSEKKSGNLVSAMCLSLATDQEDPLQRLEAAHKNSRRAKLFNQTLAFEELLDLTPETLSAYALKSYRYLKVWNYLKPMFNVVITNVPGSPLPLYLDGSLLVNQSFLAPVYDSLGLTITVTSYKNSLTISLVSCKEILPDADYLLQCINDELAALTQVTTVCNQKRYCEVV